MSAGRTPGPTAVARLHGTSQPSKAIVGRRAASRDRRCLRIDVISDRFNARVGPLPAQVKPAPTGRFIATAMWLRRRRSVTMRKGLPAFRGGGDHAVTGVRAVRAQPCGSLPYPSATAAVRSSGWAKADVLSTPGSRQGRFGPYAYAVLRTLLAAHLKRQLTPLGW